MGSLDENGIYIYDETDQVSPIHTYSNMGQASTSAALEYVHEHTLIMPVANAAERDAYASDMASAGRPASTARPLWVERADTGAVERNRGAGWHRMIDNSLDRHDFTGTSGGVERNSYIVKKNGWVSLTIREKRYAAAWSGDRMIIGATSGGGTMPSRFRPSANVYTTGFIHLRNDYHKPFQIAVASNGNVMGYNMRLNTGNWYSATLTWPTND